MYDAWVGCGGVILAVIRRDCSRRWDEVGSYVFVGVPVVIFDPVIAVGLFFFGGGVLDMCDGIPFGFFIERLDNFI